MKQIFDWLREQCKDRSESCYKSYLKLKSDEDYGCSFAYAHAVDLINEAQAKWGCHAICYLDSPCEYQNEDIRVEEAECCEWKQEKILEFCLSDCITSCGHAEHYSTGIDKYCRHCGKPIKISEVE